MTRTSNIMLILFEMVLDTKMNSSKTGVGQRGPFTFFFFFTLKKIMHVCSAFLDFHGPG